MTKKATQKKTTEQKSARAILRHLRIAPRKVRLVADLIRNMRVNEAEAQLMASSKKGALPLRKLLLSAIASAKQAQMNVDALVVASIQVDKGAMLKRWTPRAMGRATSIHKHTSHITLVLKESKKDVQSRFVTVVPKTSKKEKEHDHKDHVHSHGDEHAHNQTGEEKKVEHASVKEPKEKKKVDTKATKEKSKKLFRRKSV